MHYVQSEIEQSSQDFQVILEFELDAVQIYVENIYDIMYVVFHL